MVGDDLIATSENRLVDAVERKACNAVSIKLDQIGTVTEALQVGVLQRGGEGGVCTLGGVILPTN